MNGNPDKIETLYRWTWKALRAASWVMALPALIFIYPVAWVEYLSERAKQRWLIRRCDRQKREIESTPEARNWIKAEIIE